MNTGFSSTKRWSFPDVDYGRRVDAAPHCDKPHREPDPRGCADSRCPYCDRPFGDDEKGMSILSLLTSGLRQLATSCAIIGFAMVRGIRFIVAAILCLLGLLGSCCRACGLWIAHEHDRAFLRRL